MTSNDPSIFLTLILSLAMFFGSFLAGNIPLALHLDAGKVSLLSTFGAGLLTGTALIVIIPEGVEMLYSLDDHSSHKTIGPALAVGFAFMFCIQHFFNHSHPSHITVSDLSATPTSKKKISATIGLIVHAAADGVALGAASADGSGSIELVVFIAILLHKAPSAFGLCTFLLAEGVSRREIRQHLMIFSLAAPVAAIFTFICLSNSTVTAGDPSLMRKWTGILLLFSAGTFLYVSTVHILPEIYNVHEPSSPATAEPLPHRHSENESSLSKTQVFVLCGGLFAPLLFMIQHHH